MDIDTWVSLAVLVSLIGGLYWGLKREIRTETGKVRTELKGDIAGLDHKIDTQRTELKGDIAGLKKDVDRLDDRVYALAAGLRPYLEESQTRSG